MKAQNVINQMIREIIRNEKISENEFSRRIGVNQSTINMALLRDGDLRSTIILGIMTTFTSYSAEWFVRGGGSMLRSDKKDEHDELLRRIQDLEEKIKLKDTIIELQKRIIDGDDDKKGKQQDGIAI